MEWLLGAVGGLLGGNANLLGGGGNDIMNLVGGLGGGGIGGAVLTAIVGMVMKGRNKTT
jgi:hypothetical protein